MTDKDALALLADWLRSMGIGAPATIETIVSSNAATPSGARLLAALRDGLAVERLPDRRQLSILYQHDDDGWWWAVAIEGRAPVGIGPTLHAAVSAALDEPTASEHVEGVGS